MDWQYYVQFILNAHSRRYANKQKKKKVCNKAIISMAYFDKISCSSFVKFRENEIFVFIVSGKGRVWMYLNEVTTKILRYFYSVFNCLHMWKRPHHAKCVFIVMWMWTFFSLFFFVSHLLKGTFCWNKFRTDCGFVFKTEAITTTTTNTCIAFWKGWKCSEKMKRKKKDWHVDYQHSKLIYICIFVFLAAIK